MSKNKEQDIWHYSSVFKIKTNIFGFSSFLLQEICWKRTVTGEVFTETRWRKAKFTSKTTFPINDLSGIFKCKSCSGNHMTEFNEEILAKQKLNA